MTGTGRVREATHASRGVQPCWSLTSNERDALPRPQPTATCPHLHPQKREKMEMTSSMPERGSQDGGDRVGPELGQPTGAGSRAVAPARTVAAPLDPGRTRDRCQLISACPTEHFPSTLTDSFILEEGNFFRPTTLQICVLPKIWVFQPLSAQVTFGPFFVCDLT